MIQEAAQRDPTVPIVLDKPLGIRPQLGKSLQVGDLAEIVETFAGQLYRAGIRSGDRVAVYKTNNADIMVIACALSRVRAVPVLLSSLLEADVVAKLIKRAGPRYVLTDSKKIEAGELDPEFIEESGASVLLASGSYGDLTAVTDLESVLVPEFEPIDPAAPCVITHTSGTTRDPKLVEQSTQGLGTHIALQLRIANALRVRERWALCVSFVHIRTYSALGMGLCRRMPFAFLTDHDVDAVRDVFTRFRPGIVETHPNTFIRWESLADDPARPLSSARYYINTFDAIHPRTVRVLLAASDRRFPLYFQAYGQTESGPVTVRVYTRRGAERADGRCVGYPIPGLTGVRLRNGRKRLSSIEIRSRGRAITYVGEEDLFASQVDGVWWDMGDVGYRGRWGCVHLLDRAVDHVEELHSILEIEDKLMNRLPELLEIILVAKGDHTIQPIVCTKTNSPLDSVAWHRAVQDLPPMEEPLQCRWEDLPQTATSKVKRVELQKIVRQDALPTLGTRRRSTDVGKSTDACS